MSFLDDTSVENLQKVDSNLRWWERAARTIWEFGERAIIWGVFITVSRTLSDNPLLQIANLVFGVAAFATVLGPLLRVGFRSMGGIDQPNNWLGRLFRSSMPDWLKILIAMAGFVAAIGVFLSIWGAAQAVAEALALVDVKLK